LKFRRQYEIGPYIADFACEALKLVIELDGGVHRDESQALDDHRRQQDIERMGWFVLRFENAAVIGRLPDVLHAIDAHARLVRA
ncbi:MAG: DUF559 domain-containing protein, partial [Caulobacteraceae bacterium]